MFYSKDIEIWCGDIFDFSKYSICKNINFIYDRAAIVALPYNLHMQYVKKIKSIVNMSHQHTKILLITCEYPENLVQGPPFSLTSNDIYTYYTDMFTIIEETHYESSLKNHPKFKDICIPNTNVYLMQENIMDNSLGK